MSACPHIRTDLQVLDTGWVRCACGDMWMPVPAGPGPFGEVRCVAKLDHVVVLDESYPNGEQQLHMIGKAFEMESEVDGLKSHVQVEFHFDPPMVQR